MPTLNITAEFDDPIDDAELMDSLMQLGLYDIAIEES